MSTNEKLAKQLTADIMRAFNDDEIAEAVTMLRSQIDTKRMAVREAARKEINDLLTTATESLVKAGEIGYTHSIEFTFKTPKNTSEEFNPRWVQSACYDSDGWFRFHEDDGPVEDHATEMLKEYNYDRS